MRASQWIGGQAALLALVILLPGKRLEPRVASAALAVAGAALALSAARSLGPGLTPSPNPRAGAAFVASGPYRSVRHPMYTGVVLLALAFATATRSRPRFAAVVALAAFFDAKARYEERRLLERYSQYAAYRARVKRFIPLVY